MKMPPTQIESFIFDGGLDLVTPPLQVQSGFCREALNYELGINGGYKGITGYELYDGTGSPAAVPGSGSILGLWYYNGTLYAFRNNVGGTAAVMHKATGSGWTTVTTPALSPSGRYEFVNYNFGSGLKMYGCDGVNKAFQFDGTTFTQITTGMSADTPLHIAGHVNRLWLSFGSSLQFSTAGTPTSWTPVLGAGEINPGETITNLQPQTGVQSTTALAVYGRNATYMLYGDSTSNFQLVTLQPDAGAFPYTAQYMGQTYVMDDRGVTTLQTTQNFGNFAASSISERIRPWVVERKSQLVGSMVCRDKNQYRLFFSGGTALYMTLNRGFMPVQYAHNMTAFYSGEDSQGDEVMFLGDDAGNVYQLDVGPSFAGTAVERYLSLVFNHSRSPRTLKRYRKLALEVQGTENATFYVSAALNYDNATETVQVPLSAAVASISAGVWDTGVWDTGVWDGRVLAPTEHELTGTAQNIAIRIAQTSSTEMPLTFHSALLHYSPRRNLR